MIRMDAADTDNAVSNTFPHPLEGYWWETERQVVIPWIRNTGTPTTFLKFLRIIEHKGKAIVFPTVINARLDKLLRLRGYVDGVVWAEGFEEDVHCLVFQPEYIEEIS